ncbi:DUF4355 domain-containing protein [Eubacteriaceae bacterium ES3]|nr:DUF4355 domain-containing protein [Eubacteriaceae bacterium ES3]
MAKELDNAIKQTLTGNDPGAIETNEGKTFSQEQVNEIIKERLGKEKEKTQRQYEAMEQEFKQKELNLKAKEILSEKGLSHDLLSVIKFEDEKGLTDALAVIEKASGHINPPMFTMSTAGSHDGEFSGVPDKVREAMGLK